MAKFPQDFEQRAHGLIPGVVHYTLNDADGERLYSIVGGPSVYGDGVRTFEVFSDREDDVVMTYATAEEINKYLEEQEN